MPEVVWISAEQQKCPRALRFFPSGTMIEEEDVVVVVVDTYDIWAFLVLSASILSVWAFLLAPVRGRLAAAAARLQPRLCSWQPQPLKTRV